MSLKLIVMAHQTARPGTSLKLFNPFGHHQESLRLARMSIPEGGGLVKRPRTSADQQRLKIFQSCY